MKPFCSLKPLVIFVLLCNVCISQTDFSKIASNRIIQLHRTESQLRKIQQGDPVRLESLYIYFTNSFTFSVLSNEEINVTNLLNIYHFDVSEFEGLRNATTPVTFIYKEKFSITLKSGAEIQNLLNNFSIDELLTGLPIRSFPTFTSTGNDDADFSNYKQLVWDWAKDFPLEYQQYTSLESVKHIHIADFKQMNSEKRAILLSTPYLLID